MRALRSCSAGLLAVALLVPGAPAALADPRDDARIVVTDTFGGAKQNVRFATYNASLNRSAAGDLVRGPGDRRSGADQPP
jgi:hypothetical protein